MIGVNLSGAEFGKIGGAHGYAYIYPSASDIKYYMDRGVELFRLPVRWERLQPDANGELDTAELGRLTKFLDSAEALGAKVIIDVHNYGSYFGNKIGTAEVSNQQFAEFWKKLATATGGIDSVYGYDLMNEPNKMGAADVWPKAAQAAVNAIRTVDMDTKIYVEGNSWAGAKNWSKNNASLDIQDPAGKIVYQAHLYFDKNASGTYKGTYDEEGATPELGAKAIQNFVGWLAERGAEGMIGEFSVPDNDPRWLDVLDNFLTAVREAGLEATYWGAGPWWGDYPMALRNKDGSESGQLDVLERHIAAAADAVAEVLPAPVPGTPASAGSDAATIVAQQITSLYVEYGGRLPDANETAEWVGRIARGDTLDTVRHAIVHDPLGVDHSTQVITFLYQEYGGRAPGESEIVEWRDRINNGDTFDVIRSTILQDQLGRNHTASATSSLYDEYFGRAPTSDEIAVWDSQFHQGADFGTLIKALMTDVGSVGRVDRLSGTAGVDIFDLGSNIGHVSIADFNVQTDKLLFGGNSFTAGDPSSMAEQVTAQDVLLTFSPHDSILLQGVQLSQLSGGNFA